MRVKLVLGCNGRDVYNITICNGVSNTIDNGVISDDRIIEYLSKHCKVFDNILTDINKIGNIFSYLKSEGFVSDNDMESIWEFFAIHRRCGIFLYSTRNGEF